VVRNEPHQNYYFQWNESMTNYRRAKTEGASYFFTVNLLKRHDNTLIIDHIEILRNVFREVKNKRPFIIDAIVILPEHLHCIWTLPDGDADYKTRWSLIKASFSRKNTCGGATFSKPN